MFFLSRIPDPGSIRFRIPDPDRIKVPLALKSAPVPTEKLSGMFFPDQDFFHPGSRGQTPDPGSATLLSLDPVPLRRRECARSHSPV
jgi:hypothetical protein